RKEEDNLSIREGSTSRNAGQKSRILAPSPIPWQEPEIKPPASSTSFGFGSAAKIPSSVGSGSSPEKKEKPQNVLRRKHFSISQHSNANSGRLRSGSLSSAPESEPSIGTSASRVMPEGNSDPRNATTVGNT